MLGFVSEESPMPYCVGNKGLRRLQADSEGVYTSNASMAEEVTEDLFKKQPERYQLVLDFIEQP